MLRTINTLILAAAVAVGCSGVAFADHHGNSIEARDHGYQHGYSDGFHQGVKDRDRHNAYKPEARDADEGYEKSMGDKGRYKEGYRSGFAAGYEDAFNNRPGRFSQVYGPSLGSADRSAEVYSEQGWSRSHVASDIGYRDGLAAGQSDYEHHRDARPDQQRDYRDADHGYRSNYGDRSAYQQEYRRAFEQGYDDAYSGRR